MSVILELCTVLNNGVIDGYSQKSFADTILKHS